MAEELNLTAAQQASVDSLIEQKHRQIMALYQPMQPQLDSLALKSREISDSTHAQIKRLLNPEQQVKLDNMRAASRKELADRRARDSASGALRNRPPKF
jgi:Spy/CpxP family protein refolding chaperone